MKTKLQRFAAGGRFPGVYTHPTRGQIAATDGHAFVVLGAASVEEARELLLACPDPDDAPTTTQVAGVWADARGVLPACIEVSARTPADPALRERALGELRERVAKDDREHGAAVWRLERAREEKRGVGDARERLVSAKAEARESRRTLEREDVPACHAVRVGAAAVDLRLVRRCLAALGATKGTLSGGHALDTTVLVARNGIALVMPFRA